MKKFFFCVALFFCTSLLYAERVHVADLYYDIDIYSYTAEVTYESDLSYENDNYNNISSVTIPSTIIYEGETYNVIGIGNSAFYHCKTLKSASVPDGIISIENHAFSSCDSLISIDIPNTLISIGEDAFSGCNNLKSIELPNTLSSIGKNAFWGCTKLETIYIPNSVTNIGMSAFHNCGFTSVEIPNSIRSISVDLFSSCHNLTSVTLPDSLISIGANAFDNCNSLTSITIPSNVTKIEQFAFRFCDNLKTIIWEAQECADFFSVMFSPSVETIVFGNAVKKIPSYICSGMDKLTIVNIPENVITIGTNAFYNCTKLYSVNIPNSVTSIGANAFYNCRSLQSVFIPSSLTDIGSKAFNNVLNIDYNGTLANAPWGAKSLNGFIEGEFVYTDQTKKELRGCSIAASGCIAIPSGVISIGERAFAYCESITSVIIPNSVNSIANEAFYYCSSLTSISIPGSVMNIGNSAFSTCGSLSSVEIQDGVKSIGQAAFSNCVNLTNIDIPNTIIHIGDYAFRKCKISSITIPNGITKIGQCTFYECSALTSVVLPQRTTNIESSAFYKCSNLSSITIPHRVTNIGNSAFYYCTSLTEIHFQSIVPPALNYNVFVNVDLSIPVYVPNGCLASYQNANWVNKFSNFIEESWGDKCGDNITWSFNQNDSTLTISGSGAMMEFSSDTIVPWYSNRDYVKKVTITDSALSIGSYAFYGCNNITSITIPQSVLNIGEYAFANCEALEALYVPCGELERFQQLLSDDRLKYLPALYKLLTIANNGSVDASAHSTLCDTVVRLSATPNYGYHFTQWNDGNTDNPRTIVLTQDTSFTANFAPNQYSLTLLSDSNYGSIEGDSGSYDYLSELSFTAISNYGYHFTQWNDGNTDNPRSIVLTQDTSFTADFAPNQYSIDVQSESNYGSVNGKNGSFDYLTEHTYTATSKYGYHFAQWTDGNTDNPRTIQLTQDTSITATFAKNFYPITATCDTIQGRIEAPQQAEFLTIVTCEAIPNYGYHFDHWSDTLPISVNDALTPSEAAELTYQLGEEGKTEKPYYIRGYVVAKYNYYENSYWLADSLGEEPSFVAFRVNSPAEIGDYVMVVGRLYNYLGNVMETYAGGSLCLIDEDAQTATLFLSDLNNPHTITIEGEVSVHANFAKNIYQLATIASENSWGIVSGAGNYEYLSQISIQATPNYGYHFNQWSDSTTENQRTIQLTQDTTLTAIFAKNSYTITTESSNSEWGFTQGDTTAFYLDQVQISASSHYGYHFVRWNDGNTDNPRSISVNRDVVYQALFDKNSYTISKATDEKGTISGPNQAQYLDNITLQAVPNYGYHFVQWSDGETINPRTLVLTQDTAFTAIFDYDRTGACGRNWALTWTYIPDTKQLFISGEGTFDENMQYGAEAPDLMEHLIIGEGITAIGTDAFRDNCSALISLSLPSTLTYIGDYAFYGLGTRKCNTLLLPNGLLEIGAHAFDGAAYIETIHFGASLEYIGAYAFKGCGRVTTMTCLAESTPDVGYGALTNISSSATLYVLSSCLQKYKVDNNWNRFLLRPYGATETPITGDNIILSTGENSVVITWPIISNALTYTIVLTKDGETVCTLVFNADGQLAGIAFAPSHNGTPHYTQAATWTENGFQFTITGLEHNTQYHYTVTAENESRVLASYSGDFNTSGEAMDVPNIELDSRASKILHNGKIFILRGEKVFTITGSEVQNIH